ncbi:sirohydrochlorin cobaltochelatase [Mobilibacterium timonense]|uniref:sirohydrochlorin cobaltochelatase n=1 Tax=Mobilibacterium timonense TaxID=1871012 RepID=UPI0023576C4C|nr:sirohydrochlorin cobaltochelatase [Mobilibacterium timonense]MBM6991177.1 sirohydrochlorin cobaltochelatase [Mobilibacterium timonense]
MSRESVGRHRDDGKKGLLVVSFGTSYRETREKTINAIERDLKRSFPDRAFFSGWTSRVLTAKVRKNEGAPVSTADEALKQIEQAGIEDLLVQPTHLTDGIENRRLREMLEKSSIRTIRLGRPLFSEKKDLMDVAKAIAWTFRRIGDDEAVALMGHGSPGRKNHVYSELEKNFRSIGREDIFVATVEGDPGIQHIKEELSERGPGRVWLAPLMLVAGDHAINDLAGDDETSWRSEIEKAGYETEPFLHGLGEFEEIRKIYIKHAMEAECIR